MTWSSSPSPQMPVGHPAYRIPRRRDPPWLACNAQACAGACHKLDTRLWAINTSFPGLWQIGTHIVFDLMYQDALVAIIRHMPVCCTPAIVLDLRRRLPPWNPAGPSEIERCTEPLPVAHPPSDCAVCERLVRRWASPSLHLRIFFASAAGEGSFFFLGYTYESKIS